MRNELAELIGDLTTALVLEGEQPGAAGILIPRATPRVRSPEEVMGRIAAAVRTCTRCRLCATRTNAVPGATAHETPLMVIGEAPGADEDRQGLPFVGKAGQLLTDMLNAINISRDEIFVTNVLKCRPPGNRDPAADEIAACRVYLDAQIATIRPAFILTLGRFAGQLLTGISRGITSFRGHPVPFRYKGGDAWLLPTLHPSYLLRNQTAKREAWEDMKLLHRLLREQTGDWPAPLGPPRQRRSVQNDRG